MLTLVWNIFRFVPSLYLVCISNPHAKRLYDDLLHDYNRLIRPVPNFTETLTVKLGLKLSQLIDVVSILLYSKKGLMLKYESGLNNTKRES